MEWHGHFRSIVEHHLEQEVFTAGWSLELFYEKVAAIVAGEVLRSISEKH